MRFILLATLLVGCDSGGDDCTSDPVEKRLTIDTPTDPALQLRVESCRVDVDACPALCELALERVKLGTFGVNSCKVGFAGATVLMDVNYTPTNDNCFFNSGDDFAEPQPGGF